MQLYSKCLQFNINPFTPGLLTSSKDHPDIVETSYDITKVFIKFVSAFWNFDIVFMTFRGILLEVLYIWKKQKVLS